MRAAFSSQIEIAPSGSRASAAGKRRSFRKGEQVDAEKSEDQPDAFVAGTARCDDDTETAEVPTTRSSGLLTTSG